MREGCGYTCDVRTLFRIWRIGAAAPCTSAVTSAGHGRDHNQPPLSPRPPKKQQNCGHREPPDKESWNHTHMSPESPLHTHKDNGGCIPIELSIFSDEPIACCGVTLNGNSDRLSGFSQGKPQPPPNNLLPAAQRFQSGNTQTST